jgi:hypothetical protein
MRTWRLGLFLIGGILAIWPGRPAGASGIDDEVILGALVAEFHIGVAGSLLPDAGSAPDLGHSADAVIGAAQLIRFTGIADRPESAEAADIGKALDAFLAFAATLDPAKAPPLAPDLARLFACQLIGADPVAHAALGATLKIDAAAAATCAEEAARDYATWNERLSAYRRGPGLAPPDGAGPLYVEIAPVIDAANEAIAGSLRENGLYDSLAERLNAELAMPYGRVLLVTECGGPNSFFNPDRREIVLCDERIAAWIAMQGKG